MTSIEKMPNQSLHAGSRGLAVALLVVSYGWVALARAAETPQPVVPPKPVVLQPTAAMPPAPISPATEPVAAVNKSTPVKAGKAKPKTAKKPVKVKPKRR
jgi:hypothetical protein